MTGSHDRFDFGLLRNSFHGLKDLISLSLWFSVITHEAQFQ